MKNSFVIASVLLLFASCGGSSAPLVVPDPKLSSIQKEVFDQSCTFSSCHGDAGVGGHLTLTKGNSFGELVNVPVDLPAAAGKIRVIPGDPDNSFLIQKLEGPDPGEGIRMPNNSSKLPQEIIDAIREWIRKRRKR